MPKNFAPYLCLNVLFRRFSAEANSSGVCTLDRCRIIWGEDNTKTDRTALLRFTLAQMQPEYMLAKLTQVISDDVELLNDQYDRDADMLHAHFMEADDGESVQLSSPYIDDAVTSVDTAYVLTMPDGTARTLFALGKSLERGMSEQIEMRIRRELGIATESHLRTKGFGF